MSDVTVRFFASAEEAAGEPETTRAIAEGETLGGLLDGLVRAKPALAGVLPACSYLHNSVAARGLSQRLSPGDTIDVLPPFSGG